MRLNVQRYSDLPAMRRRPRFQLHPMSSTITNLWKRIEKILRSEGLLHHLRSGASEEDIANLESTVGMALPEDVREAYRHHDGQQPESDDLVGDWHLMSIRDTGES